jgi:hypothetical protein
MALSAKWNAVAVVAVMPHWKNVVKRHFAKPSALRTNLFHSVLLIPRPTPRAINHPDGILMNDCVPYFIITHSFISPFEKEIPFTGCFGYQCPATTDKIPDRKHGHPQSFNN